MRLFRIQSPTFVQLNFELKRINTAKVVLSGHFWRPVCSPRIFRLHVYEKGVISLVEVFKRVGKPVIWVCKGPKWANR